MNKKFKVLSALILFILILFPLNVLADTGAYDTVRVSTSTFTSINKQGSYKLSNSKSHSFGYAGDLNIHEITAGGNHYIGYCLHAGKDAPAGQTGTKVTDVKKVRDSNGNPLSTETQQVLLNILASGYHKSDLSTSFKGSIVNNVSGYMGSCRNANICKKILATQILVWETMEGSRNCPNNSCDPYAERPKAFQNMTNSTYDFVKKDATLLAYYKKILADAKNLADASVYKTLNNKTFTLNWNSKKNFYTSNWFDRGEYTFTNIPEGMYVESCRPKNGKYSSSFCEKYPNYVRLTTKKTFDDTKDFELKLTRGSTSKDSEQFVWYQFGNKYQDVVLGDYSKTYTVKIHAKVSSVQFKLTKKSAGSNSPLKGAVFHVSKCSDENCTKKTFKYRIDLTNNATSDAYKIYQSETYYFEEVKTPAGYDKKTGGNYHFIVNFTVKNGKVKANINTKYSDIYNVTTSGDDTSIVTLNAYNAKYIKIKKIDGNDKTAIKGASFQIKKYGSNTVMKFKKLGNNNYIYDKDGKVLTLKNANLSEYTIIGLPNGEYFVEETGVPSPYTLPTKEMDGNRYRTTRFKIDKYNLYLFNYDANNGKGAYLKNASTSATITIKNFKTAFKIQKTGVNGAKLKGVVFTLYKEDKQTTIPLWKSKWSGVYTAKQVETPSTQTTELVTNTNGRIQISYLDSGTYWLREVKTLEEDGYQIDPSIEWVKIKVVVGRNGTYIKFSRDEKRWTTFTAYNSVYNWSNAKGEFCFYKMDEDGNYLGAGKFKLQMYDQNTSKYNDVALKYNSDNKNYSIDNTSDLYLFSPNTDGETCFVDVNTQGRYKIVEVEAPEGFDLSSSTDTTAEFEVNQNGYVVGNTTIINKKKITGEGSEDQAELIINISTGQNVIRYGLIITVIVAAIIGLLILNKKMSKK